MTNTKRYIADAMSAMLNNDSDRAIGLLLRASLAHDDEFSTRQQLDEPELPPIQPLNGKPKRVKSRDVKCPTCGAKPGKACKRLTSRGPHGKPTDDDLLDSKGKPTFHKSRYEAAKQAEVFRAG